MIDLPQLLSADSDIQQPNLHMMSTIVIERRPGRNLSDLPKRAHDSPGTKMPGIGTSTVSTRKRKFEATAQSSRVLSKVSSINKDLVWSDRGPAEDQVVCTECSRIDLQKVFDSVSKIRNQKGIIVAEFGRRLEKGDKSACRLCHFFWKVRVCTDCPSSYHLRAFSARLSYPGIDGYELPKALKRKGSVILAVMPGQDGSSIRRSAFDRRWIPGYICRVMPCPWRASDLFCGRIVPDYVDYSVLRGWLSFCQEYHPLCRREQDTSPEGLRLVNCDTLCVVSASTGSCYTALSYVWGQDHKNTSRISVQIVR